MCSTPVVPCGKPASFDEQWKYFDVMSMTNGVVWIFLHRTGEPVDFTSTGVDALQSFRLYGHSLLVFNNRPEMVAEETAELNWILHFLQFRDPH